jgi:hypothetical protein
MPAQPAMAPAALRLLQESWPVLAKARARLLPRLPQLRAMRPGLRLLSVPQQLAPRMPQLWRVTRAARQGPRPSPVPPRPRLLGPLPLPALPTLARCNARLAIEQANRARQAQFMAPRLLAPNRQAKFCLVSRLVRLVPGNSAPRQSRHKLANPLPANNPVLINKSKAHLPAQPEGLGGGSAAPASVAPARVALASVAPASVAPASHVFVVGQCRPSLASPSHPHLGSDGPYHPHQVGQKGRGPPGRRAAPGPRFLRAEASLVTGHPGPLGARAAEAHKGRGGPRVRVLRAPARVQLAVAR